MKKIVALILVLAVVFSLTAISASADETYNMVFATHLAEDHPITMAMYKFKDQVEAESGGRIKITTYINTELGDPTEVTDQIRMGVVDGGIFTTGHMAYFNEKLNATMWPYMFVSYDHAKNAYKTEVGDYMKEMAADAGFKVLDWMFYGFRNLSTSTPVEKVSDINGLKIRVPSERVNQLTMKAYGANCQTIAFQPIYDELHKRLVKEDVIHADETVLQVLNEPERRAQSKSYMWLYRTGKYSEHPTVLYEYQPGRGGHNPTEFLKGFTSYLQSDGYNGYGQVPDVTHVGCMAHMKRKFHEAVAVLPQNKKSGTAVEGEAYCTALFKLEEELAELSPEERKRKRNELSKPILDEFIRWGSTRNAAPKSKLGIALTYLRNNAEELSAYLCDGRLEISNNLAERSIKPFVIDRKNFLFANTPRGATASAVTFSIIETAKENGLNPFKYLNFIFETAPTIDQTKADWILPLLPENAPTECRSN